MYIVMLEHFYTCRILCAVQEQAGRNSNNSQVRVMLLAKLYPENVADELLQEITQHLFFLQV
jgi:merlin protein